MTRDDIVRMVKEADDAVCFEEDEQAFYERFASLVAAAEREKTAKLFDNHNIWDEEVSILIRSQS